tara:strand:+ start:9 stop:179 length:171 start_codon:yes stop_codon:yes gene_type:complete
MTRDEKVAETHIIIDAEREAGRNLDVYERKALLDKYYESLSPAELRKRANTPWDSK